MTYIAKRKLKGLFFCCKRDFHLCGPSESPETLANEVSSDDERDESLFQGDSESLASMEELSSGVISQCPPTQNHLPTPL